MALKGNDQEKLRELSAKPFKDQAMWFLNAFWKSFGQKEAENIWKYTQKMNELAKDNSSLDEFQAHRFLEIFNETLTVLQMREKLYSVGMEKVKNVSLTYYLSFRYETDWHYLVNAPQGDNQEEILKAQRLLESVKQLLQASNEAAEESVRKEKASKAAERAAKEAKAELEASLRELQAQEQARDNKTAELKRKCEEGGVVAQNKAKNELSQHLNEDPLPLRKARITNEAAVKKAEKTSKAAEEAVAQAIAARAKAEAAVQAAIAKVAEAEAYLDEVRSRPGSAAGALWWIDRELHEQKAYLPTSKGGYSKKNIAISADA